MEWWNSIEKGKMKKRAGLERYRKDFPSLARKIGGKPLIYFDGAAGSQVPTQVIDAMATYYRRSNANSGGAFVTSVETDEVREDARATVAEFLGAGSGKSISFGANMTTLNFSLSKAIGRALRKGDEILITQLDHEANRGPWLTLQEQGIVVNEVRMKPDATLDYDDLRQKISKRTRLVAVGLASNAFGTVSDIGRVREWTRSAGAWLLVDAVHYAPHFLIDVASLDVDFLLCSGYKFYGPHVGILYSREGLLDELQTNRLRTQDAKAPTRIETGTPNFAAIAGVKAAVEYIASIGNGKALRTKLSSAYQFIHEHEFGLAQEMYDGLREIRGVKVYGPSFDSTMRAPTVSFTVEGLNAREVSHRLGKKGICTWDGHFYALRAIEVLGLAGTGGVTRVGPLLYSTTDEVHRFLKEVKHVAEGVNLRR